MKRLFFTGIFCFLLIGLGIYWWTINPTGRVKETYSINTDSSLFINEKDCSLLNDLLKSKFIVDYPRDIGYKESGEVIVSINKSLRETDSDFIKSSKRACAISLEVWIDVKEMLIEPGNRSFESFTNMRIQNFIFEIKPLSAREEKGTIWIYAIISDKDDTLSERIPLFAIPFTAQGRSLFGLPLGTVRNFSIVLIAVACLSLFLHLKLKK